MSQVYLFLLDAQAALRDRLTSPTGQSLSLESRSPLDQTQTYSLPRQPSRQPPARIASGSFLPLPPLTCKYHLTMVRTSVGSPSTLLLRTAHPCRRPLSTVIPFHQMLRAANRHCDAVLAQTTRRRAQVVVPQAFLPTASGVDMYDHEPKFLLRCIR